MKRRAWIQGVTAMTLPAVAREKKSPALTVLLDHEDSSRSRALFPDGDSFPVGFGRDGFLPAGSKFEGGSSLLGDFSVNAILASDRFEMIEPLIEESGKNRSWLEENLFSNMSSIDFDGDGRGGEYGAAFIGLHPLHSDAEQPFHFGEYKGVFRWYSYAIHGTQDEARIGKCITGGCINVGERDLEILLERVAIGDLVRVKGAS